MAGRPLSGAGTPLLAAGRAATLDRFMASSLSQVGRTHTPAACSMCGDVRGGMERALAAIASHSTSQLSPTKHGHRKHEAKLCRPTEFGSWPDKHLSFLNFHRMPSATACARVGKPEAAPSYAGAASEVPRSWGGVASWLTMADLSAFEDSQFDVHQWVNDVLTAAPSSAVPRSQRTVQQGSGPGSGAGGDDLASVIMKLQLLAQDSTEAVESCMASMLLAAPRAAHQLSALATEVSELRDTFERVAGRAEGVDGHNHASQEYGYIGQLKLLDGLKSRMEGARSVLSEAANWERRVRDVGPVFSTGDADAAAEHLAALQQSVAVMRDMPESPQREAMLQRFKGQFEDMMRPKFEQVCQWRCHQALAVCRWWCGGV